MPLPTTNDSTLSKVSHATVLVNSITIAHESSQLTVATLADSPHPVHTASTTEHASSLIHSISNPNAPFQPMKPPIHLLLPTCPIPSLLQQHSQ